jgi:MFS family permease
LNEFKPARLAALNFGIQFVWGAILAVSLQARSIELAHNDGVRAYAIIAALGAALAAVVQVVVGRSADARHTVVKHRREFYRFGILASVPLLIGFFVAPNFVQLMFAFFGLQIALNVASGPYQAAIPDHAPMERHGETSSWMSGLQSLGAAAGLLVAGFVQNQTLVGCLLAVGLLVSGWVTLSHVRVLGANASTKSALRIRGPLLTLLISRGLINVGFYTLLGFLLFFVRDSLGISDPNAQRMDTALLFLSFTLAAIGGAILAGKPSDRYDKRIVISISNSVIIIALALLSEAQSLMIAYPAAILAGIAWGAFATSDWALACAVLPRAAMATAMGIWNLATVIPQICAPLVAAPIVLHFNAVHSGLGPRAAIILSLCAFAFGTAFIWRIPAAFITPHPAVAQNESQEQFDPLQER